MSKKEFKCEKCGETMSLDTSVVLTSYPPMYTCFCEKCGHIQYIFCSEQNNYKWKRIKTELYEHKQECEVAEASISGNQTITGNKLCVVGKDTRSIATNEFGIDGTNTLGFTCDVCGRKTQGCSYVNGMKFCAKCYQESFGNNEIAELKKQLAEKDKEILRLSEELEDIKNAKS